MAVTEYIYDGDNVLMETDGEGITQKAYTSTADDFGDMLSVYDGSSAKYFEPDALGSTDALTDATQAVTDRWKYRAFGAATHTSGADTNPFTWVGRLGYLCDSETGLSLLGSGTRYYDPATAQFLSEDPIGFAGGDANLRRYVSNNPLNKTDSSGLAPPGGIKPSPGNQRPPAPLLPPKPPAISPDRPGDWHWPPRPIPVEGPIPIRPRPPWENPGSCPAPGHQAGYPALRADLRKRCMEKIIDTLAWKAYDSYFAGKPARHKAEFSKKLTKAIECLWNLSDEEKEAGEKVKGCLGAMCEYFPKSKFCIGWNIIEWIDACIAAVVVEAGTIIIGEETMNRYWDDWTTVDCSSRQNQVSCYNCCNGHYREGTEGLLNCLERAGCRHKPEYGK